MLVKKQFYVALILCAFNSASALAQEPSVDRLDPKQWQRTVTEEKPSKAASLSENWDVAIINADEGEVLNLEQISQVALAKSLDIQIYRLDQQIQQETVQEERATYDTQLTVSGLYQIDETQPASTILGSRSVDGSIVTSLEKHLPLGTDITLTHEGARSSTQSPFASLNRQYTSSLEVAVTQPVLKNFLGRIDRARLNRVRLDAEHFDYETLDRVEAQLFSIREAYWDLVFARLNLGARREALEKAQEFMHTMQDKLDLGLVEKQDVYAAEANVRLRIVEVLEAQTTFQNHQQALQVMIDLPQSAKLVPGSNPQLKPLPWTLDELLEQAYSQRRDLKQIKLSASMADLRLVMTHSERWPELDLEASYRSNGLDRELWNAQGEIGGFNHPTLYAGFSFTMPLENRWARADHRQAKLEQQQTLLLMKQVEKNVDRDVQEAYRNVLLAEARIQQTQRIEALQRSKLVEESRFFQLGRSDSQKVIDYQEDLITAQTRAQEALVLYEKAYDALLRKTNRLLDEMDFQS